MKLVVVLCMVASALARSHHHHRQKQDAWTKIGRSYFHVSDDSAIWEDAKSACEGFSGEVTVAGSVVGQAVGHLAFDKSEKIHQFLKTETEARGSKSR